jgi:aspartate/methionine/tyrosine aminotransferase
MAWHLHAVIFKVSATSNLAAWMHLQGGFFVWMSLKEILGIDSYSREAEMWNGIFDKAKIVILPGEPCHAKEPGWYRICFASHEAEAMHDFIARLQHFIDQYKGKNEKQNWSTQGFMLAAGFGHK